MKILISKQINQRSQSEMRYTKMMQMRNYRFNRKSNPSKINKSKVEKSLV